LGTNFTEEMAVRKTFQEMFSGTCNVNVCQLHVQQYLINRLKNNWRHFQFEEEKDMWTFRIRPCEVMLVIISLMFWGFSALEVIDIPPRAIFAFLAFREANGRFTSPPPEGVNRCEATNKMKPRTKGKKHDRGDIENEGGHSHFPRELNVTNGARIAQPRRRETIPLLKGKGLKLRKRVFCPFDAREERKGRKGWRASCGLWADGSFFLRCWPTGC